ncbi:amino acid adenylation domain-containing protein [Streptomyces sp. WMMC897]|uniref:amino acid adenylation domain-containing protein n=1 Tax=Streptomyces sp. WMMC897 TaxID=3014782 RepID=UPI0022B7132A|nr:amino acid adenylation domain-containing protein [Streptomyces sp. WMMC897]MCZ7413618.1 amino acid adenylation domain-containing protein [Streptomyces sp. WMMC897]
MTAPAPAADATASGTPATASGATLARFLHHVDRAPDAIAVREPDGRELTYAALLAAARAQAAALSAQGVRPGYRVAVECGYGGSYVVSLLAAWLLGAVAVPLDPAAPAERRGYQVRQADCRAVVSDEARSDGVVRAAVAEVAATPPPGAEAGPPAAYILFTSGSTGLPKGVEIEHAGLLNMLDYFSDALGLGPGDRMLAHSSVVFDMSVPEMLTPLTSGGTIVVAPGRCARNPEFFARWLLSRPPGAAFATPSQLRLLLPFLAGERVFTHLVSAGEALTAALAEELEGVTGALWNGYGPTETTVCGLCTRVTPPYRDPQPIGVPIPGLRAHVLDEEGRPAAPGAVGELCLSGLGVARGYVGSPELTARSFTTGEDGTRTYRTGDLVRLGPDGLFTFHGRADDQVKIRGHRVELGEVETVAERTPGVAQAVAVLSEALRGRAELHLALVPEEAGAGPGSLRAVESALRERLGRELPASMRPGRLLFFNALPRNRSGKTSRRDVVRLVEDRLLRPS